MRIKRAGGHSDGKQAAGVCDLTRRGLHTARISVASAVLVLLSVFVGVNAVGASGEEVECEGLVATIVSDDAVVMGTPGADVIVGSAATQHIDGGGGDDVICGLGGDDSIYGGPGNDVLIGRWGDDHLDGGSGDDVIHGNNGADRIVGGMGNDRIFGGWGADEILGTEDYDVIRGNLGDDYLLGTPGDICDDSIDGQEGTDVISRGEGDAECLELVECHDPDQGVLTCPPTMRW